MGTSPAPSSLSWFALNLFSITIIGGVTGRSFVKGLIAGAISPAVFGLVLDWTNTVGVQRASYENWGWAFGALAIGGLGAVWAAYRLRATLPSPDGRKG